MARDVDGGRPSKGDPGFSLLVPFLVSTTYVGVAAVVGPTPFDTGVPGSPNAVAFALLGSLLLLSGYATARLYADARRRARQRDGWSPNPWTYLAGGVAVLLAVRVGEVVLTGRSPSAPLLYLVANAFVATPLASIAAGPVYWLNWRRRVPSAD